MSTATKKRTDVKLANETWEALFTAHTALMRRFLSADIWDELSMREYDVLYTMAKADKPLRLGELEEGVLLSQPALSRLVDRLVLRGLISRKEDSKDRRALRLTLTREGSRLQRRVGLSHARDVTNEMSSLEPDELLQLKSLCEKLGHTAPSSPL